MKVFLSKIAKLSKRKKTLKKFKRFLINGKYIGDLRAKVFYLKEASSSERFCIDYLKRSFPKGYLKKQFFKCDVRTKDKEFEGSIIVFGNTSMGEKPASVKIFNLESKEVVTIYQDEKKLIQDLSAYDYFVEKLPLVPVLSKDLQKGIIKEKLIFGKTISQLDQEEYYHLFEDIINYYVQYFKSEKKLKKILIVDLINESIEKQIDTSIGKKIFMRLKNIKNKQVILKTLHGDFTYSNLLLDNQGCYFIDFEHFADYSFYYDIFWLMQNEYVYNQNKTLLNLYFKGELDALFRKLFDSVEECFDENMRDVYYYVFLLEMYNKRVYNSSEKNIVFDYIKKIFSELKLEHD